MSGGRVSWNQTWGKSVIFSELDHSICSFLPHAELVCPGAELAATRLGEGGGGGSISQLTLRELIIQI